MVLRSESPKVPYKLKQADTSPRICIRQDEQGHHKQNVNVDGKHSKRRNRSRTLYRDGTWIDKLPLVVSAHHSSYSLYLSCVSSSRRVRLVRGRVWGWCALLQELLMWHRRWRGVVARAISVDRSRDAASTAAAGITSNGICDDETLCGFINAVTFTSFYKDMHPNSKFDGNTRCWKLPGKNNFISNREIQLAESYFINGENDVDFGNIKKYQLHWRARKLALRCRGMQPNC
eukprot:1555747-Pleurochrysis_carterae.AAC.1